MVEAAERAGVQRFVFFSALSASSHDRTRFLRAKALAERAVRESSIPHTIFAPSMVYAPGDEFITLLERLSLLPVMPRSGRGQARYQPLWAQDAADCVVAALRAGGTADEHYDLAGPEVLTHEQIVQIVLRAAGRSRPVIGVPTPLVSRSLRALEALTKSKAFATWDEAELLEVSMVTPNGTADAERLGVHPRAMADVLGVPPVVPAAA
jgi:NADH dehydrogenase